MDPTKYLLPLPRINWASALTQWHWLLPPNCRPQYVNCFGDLFIICGSNICLLDLEDGSFDRYCDANSSVIDTLREDNDADLLLYANLVDQLRHNGIELKSGQCYHFKIPTILGGEYDISNIGTNSIEERIRFCGDFQNQIKDLPDGSTIKLKYMDS